MSLRAGRTAFTSSTAARPVRAQQSNGNTTSRRQLLELASLTAASLSLGAGPALAGATPQRPEVSTYLPDAGDGFFTFVPDAKKTPAIRAGTVNPNSPYRFNMPAKFREKQVANILSGNYCQPRCDEPWVEVIFESSTEGKIQVIVSPLVKLTRQKDARIEDIGSPEGVLTSLGSYITGTYLDEEDVLSATSKKQDDGRTYYYYEINAPYGLAGPHTYSAVSTKGDLALLFVASASDKQWAASKESLIRAAESFRA